MTVVPGGRLLVVGQHSFLAQSCLSTLPADQVVAVSHGEIDRPDLLDGIGGVISFARHPAIARADYQPDEVDPDLRLAARIGDRDLAYVMLSTRKVYAQSDRPLTESAPLGPTDPYGRNKLAVEQALQERLGERLTILRLANVFGYERIPGRHTFLSMVLDRLARDHEVRFDMSPFVARDFLPVEAFARILGQIAQAPPRGIVNVGSGIGLPTGQLALWIIEGFGRGRLVIEQPREVEEFVLDISRLRTRFGAPCSYEDLRATCIGLGQRLDRDQ